MKLPLGFFGTLDLEGWVRGIWAGGIQGGMTALMSAMAVSSTGDPYYAFGNAQSFSLMWKVFLFSAIQGMVSYLAKHPAPERVVVTTTQTAVEQPKGTVTTVKVEDIRTESAEEIKKKEKGA